MLEATLTRNAGRLPLSHKDQLLRFDAVNLSWKHQLIRTLSLTVNANDMFDGSRRSYSTESSTFRQAGFDHFVAQRIYVGFVRKIECRGIVQRYFAIGTICSRIA